MHATETVPRRRLYHCSNVNAQELFKHVGDNKTMRVLHLIGLRWTSDEGSGVFLGTALAKNDTLRTLRTRALTLDDFQPVAEGLRRNSTLLHVTMEKHSFGDCSASMGAVLQNRSLQSLVLDGCRISAVGDLEGLATNQSLQHLRSVLRSRRLCN